MKKIVFSLFLVLFCFSLTACSMRGAVDKIDPDKNGAESMLNPGSSTAAAEDSISKDKAKEIALNHAGLEEKDIHDLEIDLDNEMGKQVYEVTFDANGFEYDYDVDAKSGKIIYSEKDPD